MEWRFFINPFDVATRNSQKKMRSLATDHFDKLTAQASDADIAAILAEFTPVYTAYMSISAQHAGTEGSYSGKTLGFTELIKQITDTAHLRKWEGQVRVVYPEDSPEEVAIFPQKRTPFLSGTYEDRIEAVRVLAATLTAIPGLVIVGAEVASYYNSLLAARAAQQGDEGSVAVLSAAFEAQRILVATAMYGNLGTLIHKYKANPASIAAYLDMEMLRDAPDEHTVIEEILAPSAVVATDTEALDLNADTNVLLQNTSSTMAKVRFYFAENADGSDNTSDVVLHAGEQIEITAAGLGWLPARKFLISKNEMPEVGNVKMTIG